MILTKNRLGNQQQSNKMSNGIININFYLQAHNYPLLWPKYQAKPLKVFLVKPDLISASSTFFSYFDCTF